MNLAVRPAGWGRAGRVLLALLLLVMGLVSGLQPAQATMGTMLEETGGEEPSSIGGLYFYNYGQWELNPYVNEQNNLVMEFYTNKVLGGTDTIELRYPAEYGWNMTGAVYQISVNPGENWELTGTHVDGPNGPSIVFQLPAGFAANPEDKVQLFLGLAENPPLGGEYMFSARTSAEEAWAYFYSYVYDKTVRGLGVTAGSDTAGARDVPYTFSFDAPYRDQPVLALSSSEETEATGSESGSDTTVQLTFPPGYTMNAELSPSNVSVRTGWEGETVIEPNGTAVYYGEGGERIVEVVIPSWEMPRLTPVEITLNESAGIVNPAAGGTYVLKAQLAGDMESAAYEIVLREAGEEPVDTTILAVKESETSQPLSVTDSVYTLQVPYTVSGPVTVFVELNDARAVLTAAADEGTVADVTYGRQSEAAGYYLQFDGLGEGINTARVVVSGAGAEPHGYLIVIHRAARPSSVPLNGTPYPLTAAYPVAVFAEGAVTLDFTGSTFSAGAYVLAWEEQSPAYSTGMKPVSKVVRFEISGVTMAAGQPVKLTLKTTSGNTNKPAGVFVSSGGGWVHDRSGLVSEGGAELPLSGLPAGDYGVFEADYTMVKMKLGKPAGGTRELTLTSEEGAEMYYQIGGQGYQPYNAAQKPLVKAGEKVTAYAKAAGRLDSEPRELTVPPIPVIGKAEDVLKELKNGQDFNGDGTFDAGDVVDYLHLIEPYRAKP
ncbi:hypothetical protein PM3016_1420 [Paenibacillus mucilaginosus 3016]|uniref:Uncharacterized protein n=1 Tax=Paenibacillus mucilaginosus 3016 TaxID=1116391 RepID=H6NEP1_9BACL|nr:hypothetical protein [Paenibacillus mucilaginosus]AFC28345.1 hypothetical protein PM3016_1420 [Paenibacillus mucilaginosus 3016]